MALKTIPNESELLKEIAKGNEKAFEELFVFCHNQIGEYVQLVSQSNEMTEEIVQDIFLKIWTNRTKLEPIQNFTAYLFILTRNYTLNALRKMGNERKKQAQYIVEEVKKENLPLSFVDSVYQEADFEILLDKAIIQLPPQQQKVFLLRMQGYKNSEIAVQMNLASNSVKKYHTWALKVLKKHFQTVLEVIALSSIYFFK